MQIVVHNLCYGFKIIALWKSVKIIITLCGFYLGFEDGERRFVWSNCREIQTLPKTP
jgi:hypothetical protein